VRLCSSRKTTQNRHGIRLIWWSFEEVVKLWFYVYLRAREKELGDEKNELESRKVKVRPRKSDAPWNKTNLTRFWTCPDRNSHHRRPRRSGSCLRRVCWPLCVSRSLPRVFNAGVSPTHVIASHTLFLAQIRSVRNLLLCAFDARASMTHLLASPALFVALGPSVDSSHSCVLGCWTSRRCNLASPTLFCSQAKTSVNKFFHFLFFLLKKNILKTSIL
jgi:hypothetical protein